MGTGNCCLQTKFFSCAAKVFENRVIVLALAIDLSWTPRPASVDPMFGRLTARCPTVSPTLVQASWTWSTTPWTILALDPFLSVSGQTTALNGPSQTWLALLTVSTLSRSMTLSALTPLNMSWTTQKLRRLFARPITLQICSSWDTSCPNFVLSSPWILSKTMWLLEPALLPRALSSRDGQKRRVSCYSTWALWRLKARRTDVPTTMPDPKTWLSSCTPAVLPACPR